MNEWIEINVSALLHRSEVPAMTSEQEDHFKAKMSEILGEWLPSGQDWIDAVSNALHAVDLKALHED